MKTKEEREKMIEDAMQEDNVSEENKPVYLAGMRRGIEISQEIYKD